MKCDLGEDQYISHWSITNHIHNKLKFIETYFVKFVSSDEIDIQV